MAGTKTDDRKSGDTSRRGFASMDEDKQREIASKGGQSVKPEDRSFAKDPELAAEAGRKGGENSHGGSGRTTTVAASVLGRMTTAPRVVAAGAAFRSGPREGTEAGRKGGRS